MSERYLSIARALRAEIESGALAPGEALPGRLALAKRFETSRGTIDRTVRFLVSQKVLVSRRGSGTYVAAKQPKYRVALVGRLPEHQLSAWFSVDVIPPSQVASKSDRARLEKYDGIIWHLPGPDVMDWYGEFTQEIRQLVINRDYPDTNYVTTDHRGAVRQIVTERLEKLPDSVPILLRSESVGPSSEIREAGFVDACRTVQRFYEIIALPEDFEAKMQVLEQRLPSDSQAPILLSSCSLSHTGAVMAWARKHHLQWGRDVFYNDFDNDYPQHVFGVQTTSFLQDYTQLLEIGFEKMRDLLGQKVDEVSIAVPPVRIDGDT